MKSRSQKMLHAIALSSVSYGTLFRLWGPMALQDVQRIINQARFYGWA